MNDPLLDPPRRHWLERVGGGLGALAMRPLSPLSAMLPLLPVTAGMAGCARREPAPDVPFVRLDGSHARLSDLRGKVVLVNFWATSCATCVAEMPDLMQTHQRHHSRGYETLAVAMSYDPPAYVASFAERRKLPFQVAIDNTGEIARAFGDIKLTPTTFLLDRRQRVVKRYVGTPDFKALDALIVELLAEVASA